MPEELKILHSEVARFSTTARKLTFDDHESESTQSSSPTVNAFSLETENI